MIVHGRAPAGSDIVEASPPFRFPHIRVCNKEFRLFGLKFIWQPVVSQVLAGKFDAAVLGEEIKFLSNLAILLVMRARGRPVFLWGFGYHQYDRAPVGLRQRLISVAESVVRRLLFHSVSGFLVYTEGGQTRPCMLSAYREIGLRYSETQSILSRRNLP